ncbi:MAG TPA: VWA domain-containing protein [Thermoanaerobaculia bacterium]|nr:VWA domain-containing protein [Thermoanaerobaculia bacterium]
MRWLWMVAAGALAGAQVAAPLQQAAEAPPQDSFSGATQVFAVEVPVQVVRDGEPVRGLVAADFEVWEGRRKLPLAGFEVLDLAASGASPAAAAARRHFLFLFDLSFSEPKSVLRARRAAASLLPRLHSTDLVAVATYSASRGPQLVLGFTSDRRQIENALGSLGLPDLMFRPVDPLRLVLQEVMGAGNAAGGGQPRLGRDPLAEVNDPAVSLRLDGVTDAVQRAEQAALRSHVETFSRSLSDLARQISVVEGRKYLVFLSEGFDSSLFQGTADEARQVEMQAQILSGESWRVNPEERYGVTEAGNAIARMIEEFRRADCVIQAVDIGGLRATADQVAPRVGGRESLLMMAHDTGGELYESFNDLAAAMSRMLKRTSVTYVLAVHPDPNPPEGTPEYRRLRVQLARPVPGTRVSHRPGYYPPEPYTEQDPIEKLLGAANRVMSGEESEAVGTSVLAVPFRNEGEEKAYVPVFIEVDGATLLAGPQPAKLPVEIYVYALDELGAVHDFLNHTAGLDLAKAGAAVRQGGVKFFGALDLLPGDYSLRILVRNGANGVSGMRVSSLHVPAFGEGKPSLLPPLFSEAENRWLLVREEETEGDGKKRPYPFLLRNQPFIPAAKPLLASDKEVRLSLFGYNLGAGEWKAEAQVLTAEGREMPGGTLEVTERRSGNGRGPDRAVALFRPPVLEPGEYVLRIALAGPSGTREVSSIRFRVGS